MVVRYRWFPGANLIGQLIRQITQPLSKAIVRRVKKRPLVRKYVLIQLGRLYYWCENIIRWQDIPAVVKKRPANDDHAMELGTKLLLEALVFGLLGSALMYETQKAAERSRVIEQLKEQELNDLEAEKDQLMRRVEDQVILTKQLKDIIVEYSRQVGST
ncbi:PREDICTED: optic atrophy 3 protein homolog isoform X2 [Wasmannia auropunctata]|uniref:optic atrophy 3 protein homolog isoform X2 n=1 Tax=Wasmannia auropunctata TaxID=64793 RepID=UPI0005ED83AE|nr:PREDICTED: optic atrophy 3 protein homolog isoform X2 [Wasmannia auropunctata]